MVGNVTIQGQIVGTATFNGAKISAVVTIAPPINATVVFGRSGVTVHNLLTGLDAENAHPIESITGLTEVLETIPAPLGFTPENAANKKTTLTNSATDYPSTSAVNRLTELEQTDSPEFANTQITTLDSVANGGIIPNAEATWLGATAKSVLSYLQKLVSKVYAINSRVAVLEDDLIYEVLTTAPTASISITLDKNGQPFSLSECVVYIINPSWPSNSLRLRVNDIRTLTYNSLTLTSTDRFQAIIGELGGETVIQLMHDSDLKTILFNCQSARIYAGPTIASYFSNGFINFGAAINKISQIEIFASVGLVPAGTKIVLKKK